MRILKIFRIVYIITNIPLIQIAAALFLRTIFINTRDVCHFDSPFNDKKRKCRLALLTQAKS